MSRPPHRPARPHSANHEYLKITGDPEFRKLVPRLLLGAESADRIAAEGKLVCMQTLSGTGACVCRRASTSR